MLKAYWIYFRQIFVSLVFFVATFCIVSTYEPQNSEASSIQALTLGQLTRLSALVFDGQVIAREVFEDEKGRIWTRYQVEIKEFWKGKGNHLDRVLELNLLGGTIGEGIVKRSQVIHGQVQLSLDQRGIFFLEKTAAGHYVFTGMSQGFFEVIKREHGLWVRRRLDEQHIYGKVHAVRLASDPHSPNSKPLQELKNLVTQGIRKAPALDAVKQTVYLIETPAPETPGSNEHQKQLKK